MNAIQGPTDRWRDKGNVVILSMEYYSAFKNKTILTFDVTETWWHEPVKSASHKRQILWDSTYLRNLESSKSETESRMVVARGRGERRIGCYLSGMSRSFTAEWLLETALIAQQCEWTHDHWAGQLKEIKHTLGHVYFTSIKILGKITNKQSINSSTIDDQLTEGRLTWLKTQRGLVKHTKG